MSIAQMRAIADWLFGLPALASVVVTAGGGADDAFQNGITFDRQDLNQLVLSAALFVQSTTASLGPATSTLTVKIEDSANNSQWDTFKTYDAIVYDSDGTFLEKFAVNLAGARRYVRASIKHNLSAGSVDTADVSAFWVLGPADEMPITEVSGGS